jgi:hypothetical protein
MSEELVNLLLMLVREWWFAFEYAGEGCNGFHDFVSVRHLWVCYVLVLEVDSIRYPIALAAYNSSCAEMRSEARDSCIQVRVELLE